VTHALSSGPQVGSCSLPAQAASESARGFPTSRAPAGSQTGLCCLCQGGRCPSQGLPPCPGPQLPPSPRHGAAGGTWRPTAVPSSPPHVLLGMGLTLSAQNIHCSPKDDLRAQLHAPGALQAQGWAALRHTPGTRGSDAARKWGVQPKRQGGPHPAGSAQVWKGAAEDHLTEAKNTVVGANHLLLEHPHLFSNAFLDSLNKKSTTLY